MSRYYPSLSRGGHPPSPPDTELAVEPSLPPLQMPMPQHHCVDSTTRHQRTDSGDVGSPFSSRRPPTSSSIFYKQPDGHGMSRERGPLSVNVGRPVAHQHRWLVIVIPPALITDVEEATETANSKRSNAVLLPLFPTMYSQLAAIAREYNLPSTTGLRLYLHLPEGSIGAGLLMPRITDDVWPMLWQQHLGPSYLDEKPAFPAAVPISGRVEFDLDLQAARWYNSWVRSRNQPQATMTRISPGSGVEGLQDESGSVTRASEFSMPQPRPVMQHIRQLSLLERRPSAPRNGPFPISTGSTPRVPVARQGTDESTRTEAVDGGATLAPRVPIVQAPRDDVVSLVQQWRVNTPTVAAGAHVMSPEPSPRSLDLEDFAWSVSSAGPLSYDPLAYDSDDDEQELLYYYSPANRSIHMADRAAGSVVLTPTTATSWGPPRSGFSHEGSLISNASRYPSPDLGARALSEVPLTPSTATSWGPPSDDGFDFALQLHDDSRYLSPDIAARMREDVPLTPSTATSWGPADDEFDYGTVFENVDAGGRTPDLALRMVSPSTMRQFVLPRTVELERTYPDLVIYPAAYPFFDIYPAQFTKDESVSLDPTLGFAYPNIKVYPDVYPFNLDHVYPAVSIFTTAATQSEEIESSVYPFLWNFTHKTKLAPPVIPETDISSSIYPFAWDLSHQSKQARSAFSSPRHMLKSLPSVIDATSTSSLVYPFSWDLTHEPAAPTVPKRHAIEDHPSLTPNVKSSFDETHASSLVYPFGWDFVHHKIPRSVSAEELRKGAEEKTISSVYPFSWDLKHRSSVGKADSVVQVEDDEDSSVYPLSWDFTRTPKRSRSVGNLPATIDGVHISSLVYPFRWDLQHDPIQTPAVASKHEPSSSPLLTTSFDGTDASSLVYPFGWDLLHHQMGEKSAVVSAMAQSLTASRSNSYPFRWDMSHLSSAPTMFADVPPTPTPVRTGEAFEGTDVKSLVYPFRWTLERRVPAAHSVTFAHEYPNLVIYGSVYPFNLQEIYPTIRGTAAAARATAPRPIVVSLPRGSDVTVIGLMYPFDLQHIYPVSRKVVSPALASVTPRLVQTVKTHAQTDNLFVRTSLEVQYPVMQVYRPVYPYNLDHIYPQHGSESGVHLHEKNAEGSTYPYLRIYPDVYPFIDIYPARAGELAQRLTVPVTSGLISSSYPFLVIYPSVYPALSIYPPRAGEMTSQVQVDINVKLPALYPALRIYDSVYPFLDIYSGPVLAMATLPTHPTTYDAPPSDPVPKVVILSPRASISRAPAVPVDVGFNEDPEEAQYVYQPYTAVAETYPQQSADSAISFYDDFDLEINGSSHVSRRSSGTAMMDSNDDDESVESDYGEEQTPDLDAMDSPTRRFYLARQRAMRRGDDMGDDELDASDEDEDPFEFDNMPIPRVNQNALRRPLSLELDGPTQASMFFDDEEDDDDEGSDHRSVFDFDDDGMDFDGRPDDGLQDYPGVHTGTSSQRSSRSRFPPPNLSAVTEENAPLSGFSAAGPTAGPFPPSPHADIDRTRPLGPQRSPLGYAFA